MSLPGKRPKSSPSLARKGRKEIDYSTQSKVTNFFRSPETRKAEESSESPPPRKKSKSVEGPLPTAKGIITLHDSESESDGLLDDSDPSSPVKKVKKGVAKKLPLSSEFMAIDPFLKRDPSTPSKPARNALVSLNIDKQKKPGNPCCEDEDVEMKSTSLNKSNKIGGIPVIKPSARTLAGYTIPKKSHATSSPKPSTSRLDDYAKQSTQSKRKKQLFSHNKASPTDLLPPPLPTTINNSLSLLAASTPIEEDVPVIPTKPAKVPKKDPVVLIKRLDDALDESKKSSESRPMSAASNPPSSHDGPGAVLENFVKLASACNTTEKTQPAVTTGNKSACRVIVRKSDQLGQENDRVSISSKYEVGLDEINSAARANFLSTYKDLETLLEMKSRSRLCPDLQWAVNNSRNKLSNRYHTNFNFFLNCDNQEVEAMGALRRLGRHHYPCPEDVHAILFRIIQNTKNRLALHRAQEFLYNLVALHPPSSSAMRDYYWSILSSRLDDPDWCSRWENLHSLLRDLLQSPDEDFERKTLLNAAPSPLERKRAAIALIVRLLEEDLHCWIRLEEHEDGQPSTRLNRKADVPLVARLLWPQSDIARRLSPPCRDLMEIHNSALEKNNRAVLHYTKSLVKMMANVVQLCDVSLPLRMRRPGERITEMAREISHMTYPAVATSEEFLVSIRSTELRLLLSLSAIRQLEPSAYPPANDLLSLKGILAGLLDAASGSELVIRFRSQTEAFQRCFLTALFAYFKQFGTMKTWFVLREKYKGRQEPPINPADRSSPEPIEMFSRSYTHHNLVEDLKIAKRILWPSQTKVLYAFSYP